MNKHLTGIAIAFIVLISLFSYYNGLSGEFVLDDVAFYVHNPNLDKDANIAGFFTSNYWRHSAIEKEGPLYRPVVLSAIWINRQLFGQNPYGHHVVNLLLHITATLLLFFVLRNLFPKEKILPVLGGVLLFAIHPVHVEAVTWIVALGHPLAAIFIFSSFLLYLRYSARPKIITYLVSLAFFLLSMLTIEIAVAYPLYLAVFEYIRNKRISLRRVVPFFLILGGYFFLRNYFINSALPLRFNSINGWETMAEFSAAYVKYLFIPWPQYVYVAVPEHGIIGLPSYLFVLGLIFAVFLAQKQYRREGHEYFWLAVAWIAVMLLPPIAASFNTRPLFALRSLYLASAGVSILYTWLLAYPLSDKKKSAYLLTSLIVVVSVAAIYNANKDWLKNMEVYKKILVVTPKSAEAAFALGNIYLRQGDQGDAEKYFLRAAKFADRRKTKIGAYERLGLFYGTRGRTGLSEEYYNAALQLDPISSSAWVGLGNNSWARKKYRRALDYYLQAYRHDPNNYEACYNIALSYRALGDMKNAVKFFALAGEIKKSKGDNR